MFSIRQIWLTAIGNFRKWTKNPQIFMAFALGFIISFLLSDKVMVFATYHETTLQAFEAFIWTFGDSNSILLVSLVLLLLFADIPNLGNDVPLFLVRIDRKIWLLGQILYMYMATFIFIIFVLVSTCLLAVSRSFPANMWSETAAILGYSNLGNKIAIPAFVKVLELSFPYQCMIHVFSLITGYSMLLASLILFLNLFKGNMGMVGGIIYSVFGFIMNPDMLSIMLNIPKELRYKANILFGWISPLNHATYYMHNFGYDCLPRLWNSYLFFIIGIIGINILSLIKINKYNFSFTGTSR